MSKTVFLLIAGVLTSWFIISYFTKDFDVNYLFTFFAGTFLGYVVRKKEEKE